MLTDTEREKLIKERDRLKTRLDAIKADYHRGLDPDSGERAVQLENAEALTEIKRVTAEELSRIEGLLGVRTAF